jgi:hypothetical protein
MSWFGATFLYFLAVARRNADKKTGSWSLAKDINQIGKVHLQFLAAKRKYNPEATWPKILVITNVLSFVLYALIFLVLLVNSIASDL